MVTKLEASNIIKRVVTSLPIEVLDDETGEQWSVGEYELVNERPSGDCAGSREIGSANLIISYNMLYKKLYSKNRTIPKADLNATSLSLFKDAIDYLIENRVIRVVPELQRQTFKLVD
tara:strand:+ start:333 stop:686 length:354 start_codon:yes stop_codon:yes gene_type:complete